MSMALTSASNRTLVSLRSCNFQWLWNPTVDPEAVLDDQWQKYTDVENDIIENAYKANQIDVQLDGERVINLQCMLQYSKINDSEHCSIKRILLDQNHRTGQLRKERFAAEIPLFIATSREAVEPRSLLFYMRASSNISDVYRFSDHLNHKKSVSDILKEAVQGIIKEGTILGREKEARCLAERLEYVQVFAEDLIPYEIIPAEIGDILGYVYTKDSFWFKLINHVARNIRAINPDQVKTIEPFCYLLHEYLKWNDEISDCSVVYRGVLLTDDQRLNFMKSDICFSSFTSTTKNRSLAEIYGNTLLIIELNQQTNCCGSDISKISNFPEEEEFLIWPGSMFDFVKYEYDQSEEKHIHYLKAPRWKLQ